MAKQSQAQSMQLVLAHEGGYSNHPKDPGGATFKGVTQRTYDAYRKNKGLPVRSVKLITKAELDEIYDRQYWDVVKGDKLPAGIDYAVFDYAVNSGPSRAVKDLQRALNDNANYYGISGKIGVDGIMGQLTIAGCEAAATVDECELIERYCERRMLFLKSLKTWKTFGKGWKRRVMGDEDGAQDGDVGVIDYAIGMARKDLAFPIPKRDLPTEIGLKSGEEKGKATENEQAALKTKGGLGSVIASCGISGQTAFEYAQQLQPHIADTFIGRLVTVGFGVLIALGVVLFGVDWLQKRREKEAG